MHSLLESINAIAEHEPHRDALVGDESRYSYASLAAESDELSRRIEDNGVSRLSLIADNGPAWVIADLACQKAGCCFVPLPLFFTPRQIQHSLERAGVDTLLVEESRHLCEDLTRFSRLDGFGDRFRAFRLPSLHEATLPEQTRKITFTSGSTGNPKGVCLSNALQQSVAASLASIIAIEKPRHLCVLPLATLLENIAGVYAPLVAGGTVHLPSLATLGFNGCSQLDTGKFLACIDRLEPTTMILIPQLLDALILSVMHGWRAPDSLEFIAVGGSRVAPSVVQRAREFDLPVYEGYGLSECASVVSLNTPANDCPGSAGRPLPHLGIEVIDGEIHVAGNSFLGYLDDPSSWYPDAVATGDLGYMDDAGFIHLNGRRKNLLISSFGRNINPEWVESEITAHPLILQCIVTGDARPYCSALIHADGGLISDTEIEQWLNEVNRSLPDYARVRAWLRLPQPLDSASGLLTDNGRPRRDAINAHFAAAIDQMYSDSMENTA